MRASALALFAALIVSPLNAQTPSIEAGTPLRVDTRGSLVEGDLVRWTADSLVVRREEGESAADFRADRAIAVGEILGVEARLSRSRGRGAARGALWGGAIGGGIGGVLGLVAAGDQQSGDGEGLLIGGALVGGLGAGIGALIGVMVPGMIWKPVYSDSVGG
jgi:hypothetical protein